MVEKIATPRIPLEKGWTYFIDRDGDVARTQDDIARIGRGAHVEKVARLGIYRQPGYFYYVDREGDIARMARDEWRILNHEESTQVVSKDAPRNRSLPEVRRPVDAQAARRPPPRRTTTGLEETRIESAPPAPPKRASPPGELRGGDIEPRRRKTPTEPARVPVATRRRDGTPRPEERPTRAVDVGALARSPLSRGPIAAGDGAAHDAPTRRVDLAKLVRDHEDDEPELEETMPVALPESERAAAGALTPSESTESGAIATTLVETPTPGVAAAKDQPAAPTDSAPSLPDTSPPRRPRSEPPLVDLRPSKRMRALSLRQPWAELIMRGVKTREVRSRPTTAGERIYIYASKGRPPKGEEERWSAIYDLDLDALPRGVLVGTVEIVDCTLEDDGYVWRLAEPQRARRPLLTKNRPVPGLFHPF